MTSDLSRCSACWLESAVVVSSVSVFFSLEMVSHCPVQFIRRYRIVSVARRVVDLELGHRCLRVELHNFFFFFQIRESWSGFSPSPSWRMAGSLTSSCYSTEGSRAGAATQAAQVAALFLGLLTLV